MEKDITFTYHSDNLEAFSLHDAVFSHIMCEENHMDFYFEEGITMMNSGERTKKALLRVKVDPDDIFIYFSTRQKRIFSNAIRYKTKDISLEQCSAYLRKAHKIEIVDYMTGTGIFDSMIWRCESLHISKNNKCRYTGHYFEIQFMPDSKIEYEIFYN